MCKERGRGGVGPKGAIVGKACGVGTGGGVPWVWLCPGGQPHLQAVNRALAQDDHMPLLLAHSDPGR